MVELALEDDDFGWITEELKKIADKCCEGRIVSILEGAYSLHGLAGGTAENMRVLMNA